MMPISLERASSTGNVRHVKHLLKRITLEDIQTHHPDALFFASHYGHLPVIQLFRQKGMSVSDIRSSLRTAAFYGYHRVVMEFLRRWGAPISANDIRDAVCSATKNGHFKVVKVLLQYSGLTIDQITGSGAFTIGCKMGHISIVALFLKFGWKINDPELADGFTVACQYKFENIVELLIQSGVTTSIVRHRDNSALHWASYNSSRSTVKLLLRQGLTIDDCKGNALYWAVSRGLWSILKTFRQTFGFTILEWRQCDRIFSGAPEPHPLSIICRKGYTRTLKELIRWGLNIEDLLDNNMDAIYEAVLHGRYKIINIITRQLGLSAKMVRKSNIFRLLQAAADTGCITTFAAVMAIGVERDDLQRSQAFRIAVMRSNMFMMRHLIRVGGRFVDDQNPNPKPISYLNLSYESRRVDIMKFLFRHGYITGEDLRNAYELFIHACITGNLEILKFWIEQTDTPPTHQEIQQLRYYPVARNAVELLVRSGHIDRTYFRSEEKHIKNHHLLETACITGDIHFMEQLLDLGIIYPSDFRNNTHFLTLSNHHGQSAMVQWLIQIGLFESEEDVISVAGVPERVFSNIKRSLGIAWLQDCETAKRCSIDEEWSLCRPTNLPCGSMVCGVCTELIFLGYPKGTEIQVTQIELILLPCGHIFHYECGIPGIYSGEDHTCPICRFDVSAITQLVRMVVPEGIDLLEAESILTVKQRYLFGTRKYSTDDLQGGWPRP